MWVEPEVWPRSAAIVSDPVYTAFGYCQDSGFIGIGIFGWFYTRKAWVDMSSEPFGLEDRVCLSPHVYVFPKSMTVEECQSHVRRYTETPYGDQLVQY